MLSSLSIQLINDRSALHTCCFSNGYSYIFVSGMYTSGRESPVSVTQSENVNYLRRHRESDSESGYRRK